MEATQKDMSAVFAFVINSLKQNVVKVGNAEVNKELLADVFQAKKMEDFRAIVQKYSTEEILAAAGVDTIYHFYCQYFNCTCSASRVLEFLVDAKKAGKRRRCLV